LVIQNMLLKRKVLFCFSPDIKMNLLSETLHAHKRHGHTLQIRFLKF
jgi:hypothetical protein